MKFKRIKIFLACLVASGVAIAEPEMDEQQDDMQMQAQPVSSGPVFSADSVQSQHNGLENLLKGNAKIAFGKKAIISGDEILVMYADGQQQTVTQCIVYGDGLLQQGDHVTRFRNGVYDAKTGKFSAERILSS